MDTKTEQAVETTRQDELLRNERIVPHPTLGAVRFKRPTPGQERQIAEQRRRQYQKDMQTEGDDRVLSKEEIERIAVARGMWSPDLSTKIEELTRRTGEAMGLLDVIGFKSLDSLIGDYQKNVGQLLDLFPDDEDGDVRIVIHRYYNLDLIPKGDDRQDIIDAARTSKVDDILDAGDALRTQIDLLQEMFKVRKELMDLQSKQTRLFIDSIESRSDRAEELARIYHCCTNADTGKPLWPTYEEIWNADSEIIEWLVLEMHYFLSGVTAEFKETLGKYGFTKRLSDTRDSSDDSPVQPQSNSGGESVGSEPEPSSPTTELTIESSTAHD